jgi:hypothetical protein
MLRHVLHSLGDAGRDAIFATIVGNERGLDEIAMLKCAGFAAGHLFAARLALVADYLCLDFEFPGCGGQDGPAR